MIHNFQAHSSAATALPYEHVRIWGMFRQEENGWSGPTMPPDGTDLPTDIRSQQFSETLC